MALSLSSLIQEGGLTRDRKTFVSERARLREQSVNQAKNKGDMSWEYISESLLILHCQQMKVVFSFISGSLHKLKLLTNFCLR